ncbi:Uncharacterized protein dnm_056640 [Desulfonema magnum]|uniref:Uncharacterized protein n=1 Tax=Desulfonema magnum TaxID=45655 RepID=A0A975GR33_9BACT|nr:Uncharacterized protein dnm_056640 [Desulfonema magnum]
MLITSLITSEEHLSRNFYSFLQDESSDQNFFIFLLAKI